MLETVSVCSGVFKNFFLDLFLTMLGLHCFAQAFSSCSEKELLFIVVDGLPTAVASLVAEHGLSS